MESSLKKVRSLRSSVETTELSESNETSHYDAFNCPTSDLSQQATRHLG